MIIAELTLFPIPNNQNQHTSIMPFNVNSLRKTATAARSTASEQKAAQAAESQAKVRALINQLADRIMDNLPTQEQLEGLAQSGKSGVCIEAAKPPMKKRTTLPSGEEVQEFVNQAWETHFAGYKKGEPEVDHSNGGVPLMALFQGFLKTVPGSKPQADPSTLPDGKTVIDIVQERLLAQAGGNPDESLLARGIWNAKLKQRELHLVWDIKGWDAWQGKIAARSAEIRQQRATYHAHGGYDGRHNPAPRNVTLDEYMTGARRGRHQGPRSPPPPADGFRSARRRGGHN